MLFVYLIEPKNKQANLPNYIISTMSRYHLLQTGSLPNIDCFHVMYCLLTQAAQCPGVL